MRAVRVGDGQQVTQMGVTRGIHDEHEQWAVGPVDTKLRADDECEPHLFGFHVGAHDPINAVYVAKSHGVQAERMGAFDELLWMRSSLEEREIGSGTQLGEPGR